MRPTAPSLPGTPQRLRRLHLSDSKEAKRRQACCTRFGVRSFCLPDRCCTDRRNCRSIGQPIG